METLREITPGSFLFEIPAALTREVCREMVRRFEACAPEHYAGRIGHHASVDTSVKRSTDLVMSGKSHWKDLDSALFHSLGAALDALTRRFPFFGGRFKDVGYAMQRTAPGEFYHWHIDGGSHDLSHRQLVAIWYLNDVAGPGGEDRVPLPVGEGEAGRGQAPAVSAVLDPRTPRCRARARREVHRDDLGCVRLSGGSAAVSRTACGSCAALPRAAPPRHVLIRARPQWGSGGSGR